MATGWQIASLVGYGDLALAYHLVGVGEAVVLIHAGVVADWFAPLLAEPSLAGQFRLLSYHRVNYGRSSHVTGPVSVREQAAHGVALVQHLEIERAHVVGHSAGAAIAIQLVLEAPDLVQSLALLDPALSMPAAGAPPRVPGTSFMAQAFAQHATGDHAAAVDTFMGNVCGPDYRVKLEAALPGAFAQAVADADGLFRQEIPALMEWSVSPDDLARIGQPTLVVSGAESPPIFAERQRLLLDHLPRAEAFTLAGAGHLLQVEQPRALAEALAAFLARHPLSP
jgi:3-oxoadipate enol-lactonase